jgi:hypothetical protein
MRHPVHQRTVEGNEPTGWDAPRKTHPHLCDHCKQRATATERQAERIEDGHQQQRQAVPEQKAGGT